LRDSHWLARAEAAGALGPLEDPEAVSPLLEALGDKDAYVRRRVAAALAQFHPDRVVSVLAAELRTGEPARREWAHRALESVLRRDFPFDPAKPESHREVWAKDIEDWYAKERARFEEPAP
ncbi:MAG: HEAT repeat domain-containing protein, partial [Planctomycetota bacterium]